MLTLPYIFARNSIFVFSFFIFQCFYIKEPHSTLLWLGIFTFATRGQIFGALILNWQPSQSFTAQGMWKRRTGGPWQDSKMWVSWRFWSYSLKICYHKIRLIFYLTNLRYFICISWLESDNFRLARWLVHTMFWYEQRHWLLLLHENNQGPSLKYFYWIFPSSLI